MNTERRGRLKRILTRLTLILFGLLVGAIIAELGLRVAGYSYPGFYMPDPIRGHALSNGHWNAVGHRVAGELMAQKLCEGLSANSARRPVLLQIDIQ